MMQRMSAMESSIRPLLTSSLPPGEYRAKLADLFFEKFRTKADPDALIDLAVPIYDKYFSDDDIKSMLAFYATPVGKKMVQVLPQLTNESMEVGQKWGQETGRETMIEVLQEHPELKEAMDRAKDSPLPK